MVFIRNLVGGLLAELEDDIDHDKFKRLLHYSRKLTSFQNRAKLVCSHHGNTPLDCSADGPQSVGPGSHGGSARARYCSGMTYSFIPTLLTRKICADEDLSAMYLTDKLNHVSRQLSDHEELEVLLESFSKQAEEIVNEAENIHVESSPAAFAVYHDTQIYPV
jgi:magnesium transporter